MLGAVALNFHGLARATEDLDLFIAPDHENVERLKRALRSVFDDEHIDEISADDLAGEYPAIQYVPPHGSFHVDILARLGTAFRFEDLEVVRLPFEDLVISVASPTTLYRMERDSPVEGQSGRRAAQGTFQLEGRSLMPVRKFKRLAEMERSKWRQPGEPDLFRAIAAVWEFSRRSRPRRFPPGVYRHRSIEALNGQTERWLSADK